MQFAGGGVALGGEFGEWRTRTPTPGRPPGRVANRRISVAEPSR